ncbi:MAG TPA: hypothetical protein VMW29_00650 [Candidatus Bathyarchaeia archaeon]|nr:hypothetical protein [Candidatus Bathyarchaeia archaeon]
MGKETPEDAKFVVYRQPDQTPAGINYLNRIFDTPIYPGGLKKAIALMQTRLGGLPSVASKKEEFTVYRHPDRGKVGDRYLTRILTPPIASGELKEASESMEMHLRRLLSVALGKLPGCKFLSLQDGPDIKYLDRKLTSRHIYGERELWFDSLSMQSRLERMWLQALGEDFFTIRALLRPDGLEHPNPTSCNKDGRPSLTFIIIDNLRPDSRPDDLKAINRLLTPRNLEEEAYRTFLEAATQFRQIWYDHDENRIIVRELPLMSFKGNPSSRTCDFLTLIGLSHGDITHIEIEPDVPNPLW